MIAGLFIHLVVFAAVNGMLVGLWALTGGDGDFWPIWVLVPWGAAVFMHLGITAGLAPRRYRQRRAARRGTGGTARASGEGGRKWVTVMFTDIVNSTQLNEALGDEEWSRLLRGHRQLVRRAFVAREGEEVSTQGDGFLARFPSPAEAVLCAVDIQQAIAEARTEQAVVPALRIGIHAGEAVEDDGDLVGRVVNLASRVATAAQPDEILVTEPVADYVGNRIVLEDRGIRELKGVPQPRHLLSVVWTQEEAGAAS